MIASAVSAIIYTGNNSTSVVYPVPFGFVNPADVAVAVKDSNDVVTLLAQGVDFILTATQDGASGLYTGGNITTVAAYDNTHTITIFRSTAQTQLTEFPESGPFPARSMESSLDKLVFLIQELHRRVMALEGSNDQGAIVIVPQGSQGGDALQDVATFANATARNNYTPKRIGQLGVQLSDSTLWRATSLTTGAWTEVPTKGDTGNTGPTGPGYAATSTTSAVVASSGSFTFATQAGLAYSVGARIRVTKATDNSIWMEGLVTSYSGTNLVFTADLSNGAGATVASWKINLAGERGQIGLTGGSFADAPSDGFTYGRKDGDWSKIEDLITAMTATAVSDAITAADIPGQVASGIATALAPGGDIKNAIDTAVTPFITDAPADGTAYNRKNNTWVTDTNP